MQYQDSLEITDFLLFKNSIELGERPSDYIWWPKQSEYLWDSSLLWSYATRPELIWLRRGIQLNKTILSRFTNESTSSFRYRPKLCEMFSHSFSKRELSPESPYLYTVGNVVCVRNTDILEAGIVIAVDWKDGTGIGFLLCVRKPNSRGLYLSKNCYFNTLDINLVMQVDRQIM